MTDTINFASIPLDLREGGVFIEIDPSNATKGLAAQRRKLLVLGQRTNSGTAAVLEPVRVTGKGQGAALFGYGSMLALMMAGVDAVRSYYGPIDVWALPLDDAEDSIAATGTITLAGTATEAGTLKAYISDMVVMVTASAAATADTLATKLAAKINARTTLPVTAAAAAGVITLTAKNKGSLGNKIEIATSYYDSDALPAGITATITAMTGGAGDMDLGDALAAIAEHKFYSIVTPYTDITTMSLLETELVSRFNGLQMRTGHAFAALDGTHAALSTYGTARNSPHSSIWGLKGSPTWAPVRAAAWAAVCEYFGAIDPALPLRNLVVPGVLPSRKADRFSFEERNLLLFDGISTSHTDDAGNEVISRVITTYQTNSAGAEDESQLRLETKWTVDYIRYAMRQRILTRFPRHKLMDDDSNIAPGQAVATPAGIRAELIAVYRDLEEAGLVEGGDDFKTNLLVERSSVDVDRVNVLIPPNLVNQFVTFAAAVQYQL